MELQDSRRAKIVATLGPASSSPKMIHDLIAAGVDVFRLNLSHAQASAFRDTVQLIRKAEHDLQKTTAILLDLQGPKIRTGPLKSQAVPIAVGSQWKVTSGNTPTEIGHFSITYRELLKDAQIGQVILVDDGKLRFQIIDKNKDALQVRALVGGELLGNKGVHFPQMNLSAAGLTEKDFVDLTAALELDMDFIALSFVRREQDIRYLRAFLEERKCHAGIVAKIEREEAIENIDAIIEESDAVMVARGDMAVELGAENVPVMQKMIIQKCNQASKPVITATEMLLSMVHSPTPTRAEASDVANAIMDGTDAVMLSNETAVGNYPVQTVSMMDKIIRNMEAHNREWARPALPPSSSLPVDETVVRSAATIADTVGAAAILVVSQTGKSPRLFGKYRPQVPLYAMLPSLQQTRRMKLLWGVEGIYLANYPTSLDFFDRLTNEAKARGFASKGDKIVITAGLPDILKTQTNMAQVIEVK